MSIPENVLNPELYKKAKKIADEKYEKHGLFKSSFLVKTYKEMGGKYSGKKPTDGITRWLKKEEWVDVGEFLRNDKIVKCGASEKKGQSCRPLKRANEKTPITISELLKIHSKKKLLSLVDKKLKNPALRIDWKKGTI